MVSTYRNCMALAYPMKEGWKAPARWFCYTEKVFNLLAPKKGVIYIPFYMNMVSWSYQIHSTSLVFTIL